MIFPAGVNPRFKTRGINERMVIMDATFTITCSDATDEEKIIFNDLGKAEKHLRENYESIADELGAPYIFIENYDINLFTAKNRDNFKRRLKHEFSMLYFSVNGVLSERGFEGALDWYELKKDALYLMIDGAIAAGGIIEDDGIGFKKEVDAEIETLKADVKREDEKRKAFMETGD